MILMQNLIADDMSSKVKEDGKLTKNWFGKSRYCGQSKEINED